ncbi:hypothetical protein Acr_00g0050650 [Actinidia rufa]|uniref:Uncharacterized protein n=1 Tax=Actinidia rufa TaxID=165716 RepID=A0A7J0DMJ7_9ERIC|nr:hypothetical protein Acr_00g0050650 [Actinidia rufa]
MSTSQRIRDLDACLDAINTGGDKLNHHSRKGIRQKNSSHLSIVYPKEMERLKDYVKRFNQAVLEVEDLSDKVVIMTMMEGLRSGPLFDSLSKNVPETLSTLQNKADKYIAAEELAEAKCRRQGKDDSKRKEPDSRQSEYKDKVRNKRPNRDSKQTNERHLHTPPRRPELILPPLNAPIAQVITEIKHEKFVKWPQKIKTDPQKRNRNKKRHARRSNTRADEEVYNLSSIVDIPPPSPLAMTILEVCTSPTTMP